MSPPRGANNGQLDEISEAIGRLEGKFDGVDRYIHERQHDIKEVSAKIDGVGALVTREVIALERKIQARIDVIDGRVIALEIDKHRRDGAVGLAAWFARHWPFSFVFAAFAAWVAWANGKLHL